MNLTAILGILLAVAVAGDIFLFKEYTFATEDAASEKQARVDFVDGTKALGEAAQKKAEETKAAQDKATKEIAANAKTDRDRLTAYYSRLLNKPGTGSSGDTMRPAANPPGLPDAAPAEQVASGPRFELTELSCARDAQQVMQFQDWATKQGIPIAQ